jgi:hypothetical protein
MHSELDAMPLTTVHPVLARCPDELIVLKWPQRKRRSHQKRTRKVPDLLLLRFVQGQ